MESVDCLYQGCRNSAAEFIAVSNGRGDCGNAMAYCSYHAAIMIEGWGQTMMQFDHLTRKIYIQHESGNHKDCYRFKSNTQRLALRQKWEEDDFRHAIGWDLPKKNEIWKSIYGQKIKILTDYNYKDERCEFENLGEEPYRSILYRQNLMSRIWKKDK